ncbi:MAG TPA: hypothetical protein VFA69_05810, partial [Candidatus Nitrosotalea sp.]|nr:hypothetical protein [Candidatus Nitrosotalea sp.]
MTTQKFKHATTLMLTILLAVSLYSGGVHTSVAQTNNTPVSNAPTGNVSSSISQDCIDGMEQNMKSQYASFDEARAKTSADNSDALKSEVKNDKSVFLAVSQGWTDDLSHCDAKLDKIFVLYSVTNATGNVRLVTVIVNPVTFQSGSVDVRTDYPKHTGS